jgi:hypothetical protein
MKFPYLRLYSDSAGESHFDDVTAELSPMGFVADASPLYVSSTIEAKHLAFFGADASWSSDWHVSRSRNLFVLISGAWEIEASDGEKRVIRPGDTLLVEDTSGRGHRSRVLSKEDSLAVLVEL